MSFLNNFTKGAKLISSQMKSKEFWNKFVKVTLPFFILLIIVNIILNSSRPLFSGDFTTVFQQNFANGKWIPFFGFKILFSFLYGLWVTTKNM